MHSADQAARSYVVATAGHVDHGKSTLVRALTGIEPDRWEEERRRGLTIDLGFAWTTLPSGADLAFVDVPGHERFLGNMLAGLGPVPVVMFVVAADEGWRAQSGDHRDALAALGIDRGIIVISRADRAAPERIDEVIDSVRAELASTGLSDAPVVAVSAMTGDGIDRLRTTLDDVLAAQAPATTSGPIRFWVDRSFSVTGAGTVVTGTLSAGSIRRDDALEVLGADGVRQVSVRGLQSEGRTLSVARPVSRIAINLRGIGADDLARGDVLVTPGSCRTTSVVDVRRTSGRVLTDAPEQISVHVGTASIPSHLRPFDDDHARVTLDRPVPLALGDRIILREPGVAILAGAQVLDADPPPLRRRGAAAERREVLSTLTTRGDAAAEVARRGAVELTYLTALGVARPDAPPPAGVRAVGSWWVDDAVFTTWTERLRSEVNRTHRQDPLAIGLSRNAVQELVGVPSADLVDAVVVASGVDEVDGYLAAPDRDTDLGPAEDAVAALERRLAQRPFDAPEADDLTALGLGSRELAAAERAKRLLRLGDGIVVLPSGPALAMRTLAGLDQPFTTSGARQALGTTRRVVIPLLEHLDGRGWTRRIDAGHREVVRRS